MIVSLFDDNHTNNAAVACGLVARHLTANKPVILSFNFALHDTMASLKLSLIMYCEAKC